jgi:predicted permease
MTAIPDLRYGLRLLGRSPVFTLTAVLSLAAGIAGTAAIFSLADALLLRPRTGIGNPSTLVDIGRTTRGQGADNFGYPLFEEMRRGTTHLEGMAAMQLGPQIMSLGDAQSSERVFAGLVSGNYFDLLGTRTSAGRFFLPEEDATPDTHPVVVLNHEFWRRRFGGRPDVIGETIRLNNRPYTVVGVAEPGFTGTTFMSADFWVPMAMDAHVRASDESARDKHDWSWMMAIGRLKAGATAPQAEEELQAIMHGYLRERGDPRIDRWGVAVARSARIPERADVPVQAFIGMLGALTGLVLVIACSNVAGMLLARGIARRREFATRLAVGASRGRLIRQLLAEGILLALIAGAISVPLTQVLVGALTSFLPSLPVPLALELRVDPRVQAIAFSLALLSAVGFTLVPALQSTRVDLAPSLRGANSSADRRRVWLRQGLVAAQVAVALLLLVAAGLFLRSLQEAANVDVGFDVAGVDTLQLDTRIGGYRTDAEGLRAIESISERFARIGGVASVAAGRMIPLQGGRLGLGALRLPGYAGPDGTDRVNADWDVVTPDYFRTLEMPIVEGRPFNAQDREGAPFVAIVSATMAARLWPGGSAVGRTLLQGMGDDQERPLQIVGVVRDAKHASVAEQPANFIYVPLAQQFMAEVTFFVRRDAAASRVNELRRAVAAFDPNLPVVHAETLEQATAIGLIPQKVAAWIAACVGVIGLFLSALGLYGLTAFSVSQRSREIAIRLAVGATPAAVVRMVLRQSAWLAGIGGVVGLALALVLARLLASFLVGLGPIDPLAFGAALLLLTGVLFASSWAPARRAAGLDPVQALRSE